MLSPDSGDETVFLLEQVIQQLNSPSPTCARISPAAYPTHSPGLPIIMVNCFWALSLVLSIASAVVATLMRQWARRYRRLPNIPSLPRDKARVRALLFLGVLKYRMPRAFEASALLLHLSVLFFFTGLVIFFFTIFKAVAIVVAIFVGLFGFVYLLMTILPCLDYRCPYVTPMSGIWWYCWHTSLCFCSLSTRWLVKQLHGILVPYGPGRVTSSIQKILIDGWDLLDNSVKKHEKRLKDGIRGTILWRAIDASVSVDPKTLTWLLNGPPLADKNKVQEFLASIPGYIIVQLIKGPVRYEKIFTQYLSTLMRSCITSSIGLDEAIRKRRLIVCLNTIHHIARAFSSVPDGVDLPEVFLEDVRINFANIYLMRPLWAEEDHAIRVTSRSICALLARHITHQAGSTQLTWLEEVLGQPSTTIYSALGGPAPGIDNMNIDSFAYDALSYAGTADLPDEAAVTLVDTLAILLKAGDITSLKKTELQQGISDLVQRAENNNRRDVADRLRRISANLP
jgi:hypothetical protein